MSTTPSGQRRGRAGSEASRREGLRNRVPGALLADLRDPEGGTRVRGLPRRAAALSHRAPARTEAHRDLVVPGGLPVRGPTVPGSARPDRRTPTPRVDGHPVGRRRGLPAAQSRPLGSPRCRRGSRNRPFSQTTIRDSCRSRPCGVRAGSGCGDVCHLNEGDAAFAVLERARSVTKETGERSTSRWPSRGPAVSSRPTGPWRPGSIGLPQRSSSNTSADTPGPSLASRSTSCWPRPPAPHGLGGALQYGLSGHPRERQGQWGEPPAREGEPAALLAAVSALAGR
jgi:hypothetical protein